MGIRLVFEFICDGCQRHKIGIDEEVDFYTDYLVAERNLPIGWTNRYYRDTGFILCPNCTAYKGEAWMERLKRNDEIRTTFLRLIDLIAEERADEGRSERGRYISIVHTMLEEAWASLYTYVLSKKPDWTDEPKAD